MAALVIPERIIDTVVIKEEVPVEVIKEVIQYVKVPVIKYVERKASSIDYSDDLLTSQTSTITEQAIEA